MDALSESTSSLLISSPTGSGKTISMVSPLLAYLTYLSKSHSREACSQAIYVSPTHMQLTQVVAAIVDTQLVRSKLSVDGQK